MRAAPSPHCCAHPPPDRRECRRTAIRDQQVVDVVAAQVRVAVGGDHFEDSVLQLENRNVERAAAEVIHRDGAVLLPVQPIGQRSRRRLVHQPQNFQPRDPSRVLGRLPLRIVEIRRHGDHRLASPARRKSAPHCASAGAESAPKSPEAYRSCSPSLMRSTSPGADRRPDETETASVLPARLPRRGPSAASRCKPRAPASFISYFARRIAHDDLIALSSATTEGTRFEPSSPGITTGLSPCM